jgi:hypothetical protein
MGATDMWFYQFPDDKFGKRQNMVPHTDKDTNADSVTCILQQLYAVGYQLVLSAEIVHTDSWLSSTHDMADSEIFLFWSIILQWDMTYETA